MITALIIYYIIAGLVMVGYQAENFNTDERQWSNSAMIFGYVSMFLFGFFTIWIVFGRKLFKIVIG